MARLPIDEDTLRSLAARLWLIAPFVGASLLLLAVLWVAMGLVHPWLFALAGVMLAVLWYVAPLDAQALGGPGRSLRSLKAMEAWGMSLVASLPYPCLIVDRRLALRVANQQAETIFPRIVIDSPLSFSMRVPEVLSAVRRVLINGQPETVFFTERVPLLREYRVHISPMSAPEGAESRRPIFAILTFHDMTESRKLNRMRADFIANASHELRTPLAALIGFVETLQGPAANDANARKKFLPIILQQAQRMARLVDDLLSLSRIELKSHVQPSDPVDLRQLLLTTVDLLQPIADRDGVRIHPLGVSNEDYVIRGNGDELMQVFHNLIENAIKYNVENGEVSIALARFADHVEAVVSDTGPGIPEEHLPRLTERFYRVDVTTSREKGGTGLGLAIVKHILNRHRGSLNVQSQLGKGSTFTVSLPLHHCHEVKKQENTIA